MVAHQTGTTQNQRTPRSGATAAAHPAQQLSGQVAAVINTTGDLQIDDSNTFVAIAHQNMSFNDGGGVVFVAGEDFHLTNGGCGGIVAGHDFALRNGGCGFVLAGHDVSFANGEGAVSVAGQRATTISHQSAVIAAREVEMHASRAGVIIAGNVRLDGGATVVVEVTPERIAGALIGLIFYAPVRLLQRLRGQ